jgi:hypothetical protein
VSKPRVSIGGLSLRIKRKDGVSGRIGGLWVREVFIAPAIDDGDVGDVVGEAVECGVALVGINDASRVQDAKSPELVEDFGITEIGFGVGVPGRHEDDGSVGGLFTDEVDVAESEAELHLATLVRGEGVVFLSEGVVAAKERVVYPSIGGHAFVGEPDECPGNGKGEDIFPDHGCKGSKLRKESYLQNGIKEGKNAEEIQKSLKTYLNEPDSLFRRVRNKETRQLELSKAAQQYKPRQGVYRSAYDNAMRLARTEINAAFRQAEWEAYQQDPLITGFRIVLSNNHTTLKDGTPVPLKDICDKLQGEYPKSFRWTG